MVTVLLRTKLYVPPARPEMVSRPKLVEHLGSGLGRKLTLISAPAGFGKTTLLIEWVHTCRPPVAWLSLDVEDNDPARFLAYVIAALRTVEPDLAEDTLAAVNAQPAAIEPLLVALINEISTLPRSLVLVLDDYHLIETQAIHDTLCFLLSHMPHQLHLILATRADPPLPVVQLRAAGQLAELRYDDLRFSLDDAAAFLNRSMGLDLTRDDIEALDSRTEGWIVGLQLAALSLQGRADAHDFIAAFTSSHHYVLEYLTEEVLARQAEPVRRFLLYTSILERLCGPLCDAVMGQDSQPEPGAHRSVNPRASGPPIAGPTGQDVLEDLERSNLFVFPLDDNRRWYRYHPLFADLLCKRLRLEMAPESIDELHLRASAWHEQHGSLDEAVKYALQVRDFERVLGMVEQAASSGLLESRLSALQRWVESMPEKLLALRPRLRIYQAWALVINERLDLAQKVLQEAAEALQSMPRADADDALRAELAAFLGVVRTMASALALAYQGDNLETAYQAALMARQQAEAAGSTLLAGHAINGLAMARFHQGRLDDAAEHYRQLVHLGTHGMDAIPSLACVGHVGLASVYLERDERDPAEWHLGEGMRLGQHLVGANTLASAAIVRSRLRQAADDWTGASVALDDVQRIRHVADSAPAMHRLTRQRARLALSAGHLDEAAHLLRRLGDAFGHRGLARTVPPALLEAQQILLARLHLCRGQPEQALELLGSLVAAAEAAGRSRRLMEIHLLQALAHQVLGNSAAALTDLAHSLELAEPERYIRLYLSEGPPAIALLGDYSRSSKAPSHLREYTHQVLLTAGATAAATEAAPTVAPPALTTGPRVVEPLTRRERQVLQLIAAGLSGPEIADELIIALSTVRSHVKSIYGKLDVHSRFEAVERAAALGLLSRARGPAA